MLPTPLTAIYNALGFGLYESSSSLSSDSDEGERARRSVENAGLTLPEYCGAPPRRLVLPEDMSSEQLQSEELSLREALGFLTPRYGSLQEQKHIILRSNLSYGENQTFARLVLGYYEQFGSIPADKLPLAVSLMTDYHRRRYDEIISQIEDLLQEIEPIASRLEAIREEMRELGIEALLSESQQRVIDDASENELVNSLVSLLDVSAEEYSESILDLTYEELGEREAELTLLFSSLSENVRSILNEESNHDSVGRRSFSDGVRQSETLLADYLFQYEHAVRMQNLCEMMINRIRMRIQELRPY